MSGATSNAAAVAAKVAAFVRSISFESPGRNQSLGRDILAAQAVDIRDETVADQQSPDGTPLAANRGKYGKRKSGKGLPVGVGLRGKAKGDKGRMLSLLEVQGEQEITAEAATMSFGKTDQTKRVAGWFTRGASGDDPSGAPGQPPRPFYGISAAARARRMDEIGQFVRDLIAKF